MENGSNKLLVYSPIYNKDINCNNFELIAFLPKDITISSELPSIKKTEESYYSQKLVGILTKRKKHLGNVDVCGFNIIVENIPKDIELNSNIEFNCIRIDYIQSLEKSCYNEN